jgi:hypothetical protein
MHDVKGHNAKIAGVGDSNNAKLNVAVLLDKHDAAVVLKEEASASLSCWTTRCSSSVEGGRSFGEHGERGGR